MADSDTAMTLFAMQLLTRGPGSEREGNSEQPMPQLGSQAQKACLSDWGLKAVALEKETQISSVCGGLAGCLLSLRSNQVLIGICHSPVCTCACTYVFTLGACFCMST